LTRFLIKSFASEAVVFDTASGDTHYLSPLAQAIYASCLAQPGITPDAIDPLVAERLAIPVDSALSSEIRDALDNLHRIDLIALP
jgi:PqqD family protein of HPr-rel-A system